MKFSLRPMGLTGPTGRQDTPTFTGLPMATVALSQWGMMAQYRLRPMERIGRREVRASAPLLMGWPTAAGYSWGWEIFLMETKLRPTGLIGRTQVRVEPIFTGLLTATAAL